MDWIISDTHFLHENIIKFCSRPYRNAEQMTEDMIRRWNNRVRPEDTVYHLGDVGLTKGDALEQIIARLTGKKILILGNHDKSAKRMMEMGFDFACEAMVVIPDGVQKTLYLTHRPQGHLPVHTNPKPMPVDYVLHGHIHNSTVEDRRALGKATEMVEIPDWNINMSCEMWNYEPVPLVSVVRKKIAEDQGRV